MAAPSEGFWQRRGTFGLYELRQSWWRRRVSFIISLAITFAALYLFEEPPSGQDGVFTMTHN